MMWTIKDGCNVYRKTARISPPFPARNRFHKEIEQEQDEQPEAPAEGLER